MNTSPCVPCCTTPQTTNIPGTEGLPGLNGNPGINAFTATTADFVIPAINSTVTALVLSSVWMAIGELLFVSDGTKQGTFQVTALPTATSVTLKFLGYPLDSNPGDTIASAAIVTPTGQKFTPTSPQTVYGSGTVYEMTAAPAQLAMGTNPPTLTLPDTRTYLLMALANIKFLSVTWAANHTADIHLRRTNNTAADLVPSLTLTTPIITTITDEYGEFATPPIIYTPAQAGDIIQLWGSLSAQADNYSAGVHAVQVTQTALVAIQLF